MPLPSDGYAPNEPYPPCRLLVAISGHFLKVQIMSAFGLKADAQMGHYDLIDPPKKHFTNRIWTLAFIRHRGLDRWILKVGRRQYR